MITDTNTRTTPFWRTNAGGRHLPALKSACSAKSAPGRNHGLCALLMPCLMRAVKRQSELDRIIRVLSVPMNESFVLRVVHRMIADRKMADAVKSLYLLGCAKEHATIISIAPCVCIFI